MWRAPHLPIDANHLNRCLIIPTLHHLSSSSPPFLSSATSRLHTSSPPLQKLLRKTLEPNSSRKVQSFLVRSYFLVSAATPIAMVAHHISTHAPRASSSSESSTGVAREILVQHLLVKGDDVKLLLELQKRIAEGEDMSDLAVDYSICPSKEEGGMLGWVRRGQMVPEFEEAAFGAPVNRVVKCKTKFGWHLLQVLSEKEESVLEDIQPDQLHEKLQDPHFLEEAQLIDVREPHEVEQASLTGFQILPLRQFGNWGPEITTKFDPDKDTYVLRNVKRSLT